MLFSNAFFYRITSPLPTGELENRLEPERFVPCSGIRPSSIGWIPVPDSGETLTHETGGRILLCTRLEEKVVPPSALADMLAEKSARLEEREGRPPGRKEKQRLKEDALAELLPRALPRSKQIPGYLCPLDDLLVVGTASVREAELFINTLRRSLGSFTVIPPQVRSRPEDVFTHWLKTRNLPEHFSFGDTCNLLDPEDGSTVNCRKQDLATREVRTHLDAGKICTRIGIRWYDDFSLTLDRDISLKQMKFRSGTVDRDDDPLLRLDAEFAHLTLELGRFIPALMSALGGENT